MPWVRSRTKSQTPYASWLMVSILYAVPIRSLMPDIECRDQLDQQTNVILQAAEASAQKQVPFNVQQVKKLFYVSCLTTTYHVTVPRWFQQVPRCRSQIVDYGSGQIAWKETNASIVRLLWHRVVGSILIFLIAKLVLFFKTKPSMGREASTMTHGK